MDIKTTLDNIKAIKEIADSTQNIELKTLIVDLKEDGTKDGPFCPVCWDKEHLQIRIGDEYNAYPSGVYRHCYNCKNNIRIR